MYRKLHNGQLSINDFHVPFGGTLDTDNRWVIFSALMPWEELEETYAPQFNPTKLIRDGRSLPEIQPEIKLRSSVQQGR
jgi:hypothetical protein